MRDHRMALGLAYAAAFALFVAGWMDTIWSASVDLSHHYALAFRIFDEWSLSDPNDPSLWEMNIYPNLSHKIAAAIGFVVGSPLLGIQLLTLVSLAFVWFACVFLLKSLPARAAAVSLCAFAALLLLNRFVLRLPVHGGEVVQNFFFAQLVVQAAVLGAVLVAARLERRAARIPARLLLLGATAACTAIHLLGALQLLGVLAGILLTGIFCGDYPQPHRRYRLALAAAVLAAGVAVVVLSPSFSAMRQISGNNGGISLGSLEAASAAISPTRAVLLLGIAALVVSFLLLRAWLQRGCSREYAVARYLFAYGGTLGALCLLQAAALQFGMGSEYAVKKYVYALVTYLALGLAALIGLGSERYARAGVADRWRAASAAGALVAFCVSLLLLQATKMLDVSDMVRLESRIRLLRDTALPVPTEQRSNAVLLGKLLPTSVEYMFSIGVLKTPRAKMGDVLSYNRLGDASQFGSVVLGGEALSHVDPGCAGATLAGPLAIVDARCVR